MYLCETIKFTKPEHKVKVGFPFRCACKCHRALIVQKLAPQAATSVTFIARECHMQIMEEYCVTQLHAICFRKTSFNGNKKFYRNIMICTRCALDGILKCKLSESCHKPTRHRMSRARTVQCIHHICAHSVFMMMTEI